ncbi:golgin-45-like [Haliotis rufescens]|uniref:golgin-45-like n=1 Tax=Haliotis rufescens TaxID=6454 RepID=UPI00201EADBF|nr:golgin-45-like [Haliotis rufescens]
MQAAQKKTSPQETVLLRHAKPKYDFQGKKLNKKTSKPQTSKPESNQVSSLPPPTQTIETQPNVSSNNQQQVQYFAEHDFKTKTAGVVRPVSVVSAATQLPAVQSTGQTIQLPQKPIQVITPVQGCTPQPRESHVPVPNPSATILQLEQELGLVRPSKDEHERLRQENKHLKQDLDVQHKVNTELKKLLIASVGEDLERRVERLARDKAELSMEVGGYTRKVTEDYENLDKVSIQADMWRTKFLASRVMIDELASARAFYSLQYQESQDALQQLLTERHELRANLLEAMKCLQQVKGAFDPLNAHKSTSLPSTNVIDLARMSQQLSEAIRYRLLPGKLSIQTTINIEDQLENSMTHAESFAHQLVARQTKLDPVQKSVSGHLFGPGPGTGSRVQRFHPDARYDNLTVNCCAHCKGDISVL